MAAKHTTNKKSEPGDTPRRGCAAKVEANPTPTVTATKTTMQSSEKYVFEDRYKLVALEHESADAEDPDDYRAERKHRGNTRALPVRSLESHSC